MRLFLHTLLSGYRAAFTLAAILWYLPRSVSHAIRDQWQLGALARAQGRPIGRCVWSLAFYSLRCQWRLLSLVPRLSGWDVEFERRAVARSLVAGRRVAAAAEEWTPQTALARRLQIICWQALLLQVAGDDTHLALRMETVDHVAVRLPALERLARQCEIVGLGWERRETGPSYNLYALQARLREATEGARSRIQVWNQLKHPRPTLVKLYAARAVDLRIGRQANEESLSEVRTLRDVIDREITWFRDMFRAEFGFRV